MLSGSFVSTAVKSDYYYVYFLVMFDINNVISF